MLAWSAKAALLGAWLIAAPAAEPFELKSEQARQQFAAAQQNFAEADYEGATEALRAAYAIEPNPALLYAIGQSERLAGHCDRAIEEYREYLDSSPAATQVQLTKGHIERCERELAAAPPEPPEATQPEPEPEPKTKPEPDRAARESSSPEPVADTGPKPRPWHRDKAGGALVGTGAALLAVGTGLVVAGRVHAQQAADRDLNQDEFFDLADQAIAEERASIAFFAAGGALALGGVVRWIVVARRGKGSRSRRAMLLPTGRGVVFSGRF